MQYNVSLKEIKLLESYTKSERFQYFLSRAVESEEIWGLGNSSGWKLCEDGENTVVYLWPYQQLAANFEIEHEDAEFPLAISLDHFVETILHIMIEQNIYLEIMPMPGISGKLISARQLLELINGMMESGEYYLEG